MTELTFSVVDIVPDQYAASPMLTARVRIEEGTQTVVHAIALRCQVRISPQRRPYGAPEAEGLADLFGGRERWSTTLRPFLWMHTTAMVKGFTGSVEVDLPLPCTYDFEVAATKYLHALRDGHVPLSLMFSGTVFTRGATDFQVEQIPWHSDVDHRMAVQAWRQAMDVFFPDSGWIRVPTATLDALARFKSDRGLPTWEEAFAVMVERAGRPDPREVMVGADDNGARRAP